MIIIDSISDHMRLRAAARLLSKLDDSNGTGCWEWTGSQYPSGYGQFYYGVIEGKEKQGKAHKAAWLLLVGSVLGDVNVLHRCNNRRCCNPNHLYLGTHKQNMKDREKAGRTSRGEHRYNFKRDDSLKRIGELRSAGMRVDDICAELAIGRNTYYRAARDGAVDPHANKRARSANASAAQRA